MAWVTQQLIDTWNRAQFVGEDTPHAVVQVQLGHWVRQWLPWTGPPVKALIWGEGGYGPVDARAGHWTAVWHSTTGVYSLPNLSSIKRTRDLKQNGVTVLEVVLDAMDFVPKTGAFGDAYHALKPGWLAPTRGYVSPGRPNPNWDSSSWSDHDGVITDSVMIRVWQGYGAPETDGDGNTPPVDGGANGAWTFRGMIDDVDIDGDPNTITLTARNGKLLTDQHTFRGCKSVQLKDPVTFYDSDAASVITLVGSNALASSSAADHPASLIVDVPHDRTDPADPAYDTSWQAAAQVTSSHIEWCEIRLPQGRYEDFTINVPAGMVAYVGLYAKPMRIWELLVQGGTPQLTTVEPTRDGNTIERGWVNLGPKTPGAHGWPYLRTFDTNGIQRPSLRHTYEVGNGSLLRIGLMAKHGSHDAIIKDLHGLRRAVQSDITQRQFILVDDASEVVKVVLRWAGYTEWDVEEAGVRLSDGTNYGPGVVAKSSGRLLFNRQTFLVDIIQEVAKQLGFIFFIADPTDAHSEGVPTFRRDSSLLQDNRYVAAKLDERTMLTGLKVKHTDESRPYIIRVRGKTAAARVGGLPLGGDSIQRIMAVYLPPWAFGSRSGGVLRNIVYQDDQLTTFAMCLYGCLLIGMNAALAMHTAIAEIPCHPMLELDDQVSVLDEPTGTNSRLWVTQSQDTMLLGANASWKQTLQGALLDTSDLQSVVAQAIGRAPIVLGHGSESVTIERINWNHVVDPADGRASGYRSPIEWKSRTGRFRGDPHG